jgi:hypothetical protein
LCELAATAHAEPVVFHDARDPYSLLDRHPVNRQLFEQLDSQEERTRLTRDWKHVALLSDVSAANQFNLNISDVKPHFHGYAIADTYAAFRPVRGVDVNLNVFLATQSASYGYRVSSLFDAGIALHLFNDELRVMGHPIRFDVVTVDLGDVTIGQGLLLERIPIEGFLGAARYRGIELSYLQAGRAFWSDDDVYVYSVGALDGRLKAAAVEWRTTNIPRGFGSLPVQGEEHVHAWYTTLSLELPASPNARLAAEYAAKLGDPLRHGLLLRTDYTNRKLGPAALHLGYQFRYYQNGFGPRETLMAPTTTFNVPSREDMYVTNSFEYFGLSADFVQWSHTAMLEARVAVSSRVELFGEVELWQRFAAARVDPARVVFTPDGFRAPGGRVRPYYKAGLSLFPWPGLPHRLSSFVTNKQVVSADDVTEPQSVRYETTNYLLVEAAVFL